MTLATRLRTRIKAASDALNYRAAADTFRCGNCAFARPENYCGLYEFVFDPANVCDSWANNGLTWPAKELLNQQGYLTMLVENNKMDQAFQDAMATKATDRPLMATVIKATEELDDRRILITKSADGVVRWLSRASTAFEDKDREIVSKAALQGAADQIMSGKTVPLRWWHVGTKGEAPAIDLGVCDLAFVCGETFYAGGTFKPGCEALIKADDEQSLGFLPLATSQLDNNELVVYDGIDIIEISVCPAGTARNYFTGVAVA